MTSPGRGPVPPGTLKATALCGLVALALVGSAQAETWETLGEGVTAGHFVLYPAAVFEFGYDNNILLMGTDLPGSDPIASGMVVARARILADLPIGESRIRLLYAPFYRGYTNDRFRPEDTINHVAAVEAGIHTAGPLSIVFRDDYVNGTIALQEQVAKNGVPYGLGHYSAHNPSLEIGVALGVRHGFALIPRYSTSAFTGLVSGFGQIVDYGYTTRAVEGRYNYKLSEPTTVYAYSSFEDTLQTETSRPDVTIRSRSLGLGFTRTVTDTLVTQMSGGYQTMDFEGGHGQNFSGPIADVSVGWQVAEVTRLRFELQRKPYASIYADSNYYISTGARALWTRQMGRSTYMDAGAALQDNEFVPLQGAGRRERLVRLEVGAGHQFLQNLRGYVGYALERRESNVLLMSGGEGADPFNYQLHRILFRLEVGWM